MTTAYKQSSNRHVTLDEVVLINPDSVTKDFPHSEIEYLDISSVGSGTCEGIMHYNLAHAPSRARRLVRHGDTIVSTVRPNRRSFLFVKNPPPNLVVSTGFAVLRSTPRIAPRFLYYSITDQSFTDYLTANVKGAAYPAVDTKAFERAKINLPSLDVQRKIAAILSAYDDLIENNTRRIKILEEMARMIYREWFVNFHFPRHENVRIVESELGPIPEGWEVKRLGDLCDIVMGQSPKSEYYNELGEGLPFHQGVTDFGDHFPMDRVFCIVQNRIAERGDILFSVRAPVGRINTANKRIVIGRGLCAIRSKNSVQSFILYQLKERFREEDTMGGGTIFKAVTKADMHGIKMLVPNENILKRFEGIAQSLGAEVEILTDKNANLRRTRDLLLPRLISGELDVTDVDIDTRNVST